MKYLIKYRNKDDEAGTWTIVLSGINSLAFGLIIVTTLRLDDPEKIYILQSTEGLMVHVSLG